MKRLKAFFVRSIAPALTRALIYALYATLNVEVVNENNFLRGAKKIIGVWHGEFFPFAEYASRTIKRGLTVMTSQSDDGEFLSRVIEQLGGTVVRGDERKGGARALIEIIKRYKEGNHVVFALDGPLGPYHEAKPGVFFASEKLGAPITPLYTDAEKKWTFKSWDKMYVPKPFSKTRIVFGDPLTFPEGMTVEEKGAAIKNALAALSARYGFSEKERV